MMVTTHFRGHLVFYDGREWRFVSNDELANEDVPCAKCGEPPTPEGYDACLGHIPGALSACCGHGVEGPYVKYDRETR